MDGNQEHCVINDESLSLSNDVHPANWNNLFVEENQDMENIDADMVNNYNVSMEENPLPNSDAIAVMDANLTNEDGMVYPVEDALRKDSFAGCNLTYEKNIRMDAGPMVFDLGNNGLLPALNCLPHLMNSAMPLMPHPVIAEAAAVINEAVQQSVTPSFDPTTEQMKLLKFLEPNAKSIVDDTNLLMKKDVKFVIKCANCNRVFDMINFKEHVCEYDEHHNLIRSESNLTVKNQVAKEEAILPPQPPSIRLVKENLIRLRRFLKDELKYDVNTSANSSSIVNGGSGTAGGANGASMNSSCDGPHECTICERKFVHASGLLRHMEKHALDLIPNPNTPNGTKSSSSSQNSSLNNINDLRVVIKCILCGRIFFDPESAFTHLCHHFPGYRFQEKEMDTITEIPYDTYVDDAINFLKIESKMHHSPLTPNICCYQDNKQCGYMKMVILNSVLQCEFCDFIFSDVTYLFAHSACHLPERRFECFSCNICVRTSKEICSHWQAECVFMRENLKLHHANIQRFFACNVCDNKFQTMDQLHEHRYTSHHFFPRLNKRLGILQLPCEYCNTISDNAQECVSHYEEKHYKKYKRDKDGSISATKTRQYLCDICGKSYTQSSHLWQHLRFHRGVKPFACKEPGCTRKFTIRPDLNDHIRKCHTGERPYHCVVCGKRFLTGSVFYQHRLIHRGERRYECEECGKRFYRADALKNHLRIHTGEKPFGCLFCTKSFRQRGDRDKHIRARHSHLDENTRVMMQMQKLNLEAAAAAEAATTQPNHTQLPSGQLIPNNPINIAMPTVNEFLASNELNNALNFSNALLQPNAFNPVSLYIEEGNIENPTNLAGFNQNYIQ